jgi:hypothetical protein
MTVVNAFNWKEYTDEEHAKKGGARLNSGRKLPQVDMKRAMSLWNEGLTKKEIAGRFDIPYKTMLTLFKKMGAQDSRGPYDWSGKYKKEAI